MTTPAVRGMARRKPELLCNRPEDLSDVRAPFRLRAPHVGDNEPVASGTDDVGERARRRSSGLHHRLADADVELIRLILGRDTDVEL